MKNWMRRHHTNLALGSLRLSGLGSQGMACSLEPRGEGLALALGWVVSVIMSSREYEFY